MKKVSTSDQLQIPRYHIMKNHYQSYRSNLQHSC